MVREALDRAKGRKSEPARPDKPSVPEATDPITPTAKGEGTTTAEAGGAPATSAETGIGTTPVTAEDSESDSQATHPDETAPPRPKAWKPKRKSDAALEKDDEAYAEIARALQTTLVCP